MDFHAYSMKENESTLRLDKYIHAYEKYLMNEIKSHPCLYDDGIKKNKDDIAEAWSSVAKKLNKTGDVYLF